MCPMPKRKLKQPAQLELFDYARRPVTAITAGRAAGGPPRDHRVSYGVALREITATVKATSPELGAAARAELVTTILRGACEAGRVRFDFGEAA